MKINTHLSGIKIEVSKPGHYSWKNYCWKSQKDPEKHYDYYFNKSEILNN